MENVFIMMVVFLKAYIKVCGELIKNMAPENIYPKKVLYMNVCGIMIKVLLFRLIFLKNFNFIKVIFMKA